MAPVLSLYRLWFLYRSGYQFQQKRAPVCLQACHGSNSHRKHFRELQALTWLHMETLNGLATIYQEQRKTRVNLGSHVNVLLYALLLLRLEVTSLLTTWSLRMGTQAGRLFQILATRTLQHFFWRRFLSSLCLSPFGIAFKWFDILSSHPSGTTSI